MRTERDEWRQAPLDRAVGDWTEYRALRETKKGWGDDPMEGIKRRFAGVFANSPAGDVDAEMDRLKAGLALQRSEPCWEEDVVEDPTSLSSLTVFFNRLLRERTLLWEQGVMRWSKMHLRQYWRFTGHRVRAGLGEDASVAGKLSVLRGLDWWMSQQQSSVGVIHPRRHYPFLMAQEQAIGDVVGGQGWRGATVNRQQWKDMEQLCVQRQQVTWASGRQMSIEG